MVDTPKESTGDKATKPPEKQSKHRRRRSKSRHSKNGDTGTKDNGTQDGAEDENNPAQPSFEQARQDDRKVSRDKQAMDGNSEDNATS